LKPGCKIPAGGEVMWLWQRRILEQAQRHGWALPLDPGWHPG